jgi:hypothetical protein
VRRSRGAAGHCARIRSTRSTAGAAARIRRRVIAARSSTAVAIDDRDYRDRSHEWLDRLLRRRKRVTPGPIQQVDPISRSRRGLALRWLIPVAVIVNASAILWTVLSVVGPDFAFATLSGWLRTLSREWWLGSVVVAVVWLAPYRRSAVRHWRSRRAQRRFADNERARWEGHRRE